MIPKVPEDQSRLVCFNPHCKTSNVHFWRGAGYITSASKSLVAVPFCGRHVLMGVLFKKYHPTGTLTSESCLVVESVFRAPPRGFFVTRNMIFFTHAG